MWTNSQPTVRREARRGPRWGLSCLRPVTRCPAPPWMRPSFLTSTYELAGTGGLIAHHLFALQPPALAEPDPGQDALHSLQRASRGPQRFPPQSFGSRGAEARSTALAPPA